MNLRRRSCHRRGLTLLEVVLSVGILSIILLGVFSAMNSAQRANAITRERQAASEAAFEIMDTLLSGDAPELVGGVSVPVWTQFPVIVSAGADGVRGTTDDVVLRPADPYPMAAFAGLTGAPTNPASAGVAVTRVGPYVGLDDPPPVEDLGNVDLVEVKVVVAWRPVDWQVGDADQRIELVSRRVR